MEITNIFGMNIATIGLIIGAILLTMAGMKAYKSKNARKTGIVIGFVGLLMFGVPLLLPDQTDFLTDDLSDLFGGGQPTTIVPTTPGAGAVVPGCTTEDTTVTLSATDKYTAGSAGTTHRYRINGAPALTVSNKGTFTASPGDNLEILWGNGTDSTYYGDVSFVTIPCKGTYTATKELLQNGTLTITIFNEENDAIGTGASNETIAAGDVVTLDFELKGTYQKGFPHGGVLTVEWNNSVMDDVDVQMTGSQEVSVPSVYTITYSTNSKTRAFSIPPILDTEKLVGRITLDAHNTNNADALDSDRVILSFKANDYFINEDTGGSYDGPAPEDEDDSETFAHTTTQYIYFL